ncbi:MAG: ZIP family metal transporter [Methanomassiliicoccales archaeon]|nr:ZIP family metal transporter [Methanomassiliicoccales archaeon]
MHQLLLLLIFSVAIIAAAFIGGLLPLLRNWSSVQLHLFTGFSAGVFIGAAFLHMIPDAVDLMEAGAALAMVLVGFVVVLLAERVVFYEHREECKDECEHKHLLTGVTAFIGLSVHSAIAGLSLGVAVVIDQTLGMIVFFAIIAHEGVELFSLSTVFRLAGLPRKKILAYVGMLASVKPVFAWVAILAMDLISGIELGLPLALAAGTFLYVGIYDLLPESFTEEKKRYSVFAAVIVGVLAMYGAGLIIG